MDTEHLLLGDSRDSFTVDGSSSRNFRVNKSQWPCRLLPEHLVMLWPSTRHLLPTDTKSGYQSLEPPTGGLLNHKLLCPPSGSASSAQSQGPNSGHGSSAQD